MKFVPFFSIIKFKFVDCTFQVIFLLRQNLKTIFNFFFKTILRYVKKKKKKKKIELNLISNIMYVILYSMNGKLVWTNMERIYDEKKM